MTEAEWLACTDPTKMLEYLRDKASERKLRLFACACCRYLLTSLEQVSLGEERLLQASEVAEERLLSGRLGRG
jgi:hypothetical protein